MMDPARILYEDNHLIAVNKLPGEISQGDKTGDIPIGELVSEYLKVKYQKPGNVYLGVLHRLDRPASGVLLFAKTGKAAERMSRIIAEREVEKTYFVITDRCPQPENGSLTHLLWKNQKQNKSYVIQGNRTGAKEARLQYELVERSESFFLLRVLLETGRHHQIRAQLAAIGCPVKGDLKYGSARSNPDGSVCLHAHTLAFTHPVTSAYISICAPTPKNHPWTLFST